MEQSPITTTPSTVTTLAVPANATSSERSSLTTLAVPANAASNQGHDGVLHDVVANRTFTLPSLTVPLSNGAYHRTYELDPNVAPSDHFIVVGMNYSAHMWGENDDGTLAGGSMLMSFQ